MLATADRSIVQAVRREFVRRQSIDASMVDVRCTNGVVEIAGTLRLTGFARNTDLETEWKTVRELVMRVHGVRDIVDRYLRRF
jgi:hypothetical protein